MLRKHFSQSRPVTLPKGHTTVSFSEPQIHAVLKTISDETVKSSVHVMRSLVLHAVYGNGKQTPGQFKKSMIRGITPAVASTVSSAEETESEGGNTDDYTNGAITASRRRACTPMPRSFFTYPGTSDDEIANTLGTSHTIVPSPGYSEGDYQPLSSMQSGTTPKLPLSSPPRKKRKYVGRPGKDLKSAYFKGIQ